MAGERDLLSVVFLSSYGVIHNHPCHRFAVFLLLRRVYAMRLQIDRQRVNGVLYFKVFNFSIMAGIELMKYGHRSTVTSGVDQAQTRTKFNDIRAIRHFEKSNWRVLLKI